jgi:hypothetical protein
MATSGCGYQSLEVGTAIAAVFCRQTASLGPWQPKSPRDFLRKYARTAIFGSRTSTPTILKNKKSYLCVLKKLGKKS